MSIYTGPTYGECNNATKTLCEQQTINRPAQITPATKDKKEICINHREQYINILGLKEQLISANITNKDIVSLSMVNSQEQIVSFLGLIYCGAAANPLNPQYNASEFEYYFKDTNTRFIQLKKDDNKIAREVANKLNIKILDVDYDMKINRIYICTIKNLIPPYHDSMNTNDIITPDTIAQIQHTSGTTSKPKVVPQTHKNLLTSARNIQMTYRQSSNDIGLLVMPLFHIHGLICGLLAPQYSGGCIVIQGPKFSASTFWDIFLKYNCSWYTAVPTIHQILQIQLEKMDKDKSNKQLNDIYTKGCLRFIRSCSSALATSILEKLETIFKVPVIEAYAMTEASHQMTSNNLPPQKRKIGTVGQGQGTEISIRSSDGNIVEKNKEGEICVRGDNIIKGYLNNYKANCENFFPDNWLRTGDQGIMDDDGFIRITGRLKELINRGGEKISPSEIDQVLLEHPSIAEGVAFGVPDKIYGQAVYAAVVLRPNCNKITQEELQKFLLKKLSAYKIPQKIFFTESLPHTSTGKLQRRIVAEHFIHLNTSL